MKASYLNLYEQDELQERIKRARQLLAPCRLCPRRCGVNRLKRGQLGICRTGEKAMVASFGPHFGEESPLVGKGGSGSIFFSHCNLLCLFCQNYEISHCPDQEEGVATSPEQLAMIMVDLQEQGCHNINLITPSHVLPQILEALPFAIEKGLHLPLIYNSSGYDSVESLQLLENIIDIYMPDFKFWNPEHGKRYAQAHDYPEVARLALKEMHRQVGDLIMDQNGLTTRGVLFRHLIMPGCLDETEEILNFIAREISVASYVNIMDQYHPCGKACEIEALNRPVSNEEYRQAIEMAQQAGLTRLDQKDFSFLLKRLGIV
jgi:putative pyruvate formate lyase activating enzyme